VTSAFKKDAALEARVADILGKMTLAQKIGQMTQPEIKSVTPDDVRQYYLGSVLNGGGSWPNNDKHAKAADWLAMANAFYDASMATDMAVKVPVVWGTDAVHGHNNVYGATMFPHNIGLGAARDPQAGRAIGAATAKAVRATGIAWVFGPTLAVVRDDRWGRTYESYSEDPMLVHELCRRLREGHAGASGRTPTPSPPPSTSWATAAPTRARTAASTSPAKREMMNIHAQGYYTALAAGAQTVMASFNSWDDVAAGKNYGKVHGSRGMLTDILKEKMGFDGFVVTDWNGNGEVPGCTQRQLRPGHQRRRRHGDGAGRLEGLHQEHHGRRRGRPHPDGAHRRRRHPHPARQAARRPVRQAAVAERVCRQGRGAAGARAGAPRRARIAGAAEERGTGAAAGRRQEASWWSARPPTAWPTRPAAGR
jgi:hypothetical protein